MRDQGTKTILIPRRRPFAAMLLAVVGVGFFIGAVVMAFVSPVPGIKQFTIPLQNLVFAGLFFWGAVHMLRPYRIEIDGDAMKINAIESIDGRTAAVRRPVGSIYRVYAAEHAGAIFMRAHDHEIIELPVPFRGASLHELADLIAAELGLPSGSEDDNSHP